MSLYNNNNNRQTIFWIFQQQQMYCKYLALEQLWNLVLSPHYTTSGTSEICSELQLLEELLFYGCGVMSHPIQSSLSWSYKFHSNVSSSALLSSFLNINCFLWDKGEQAAEQISIKGIMIIIYQTGCKKLDIGSWEQIWWGWKGADR